VNINTIASGLTHLLFVSLFLLGAAKYFKQTDTAGAEDRPLAQAAQESQKSATTLPKVSLRERPKSEEATAPSAQDVRAESSETAEAVTERQQSDERAPSQASEPQDTSASDPSRRLTSEQSAPQATESPDDRLKRRLVSTYPDFLKGYEGNEIIWRDGTRMPFDDGREKSFKERLTQPDLQDQFYAEYPRGLRGVPPLKNIDPGRVRYEPFFVKMYGDCKNNKAEVRGNLEEVVWLPKNWGKTLRVTRVNGVANALRKVSAALDKLPQRFMKYLRPSAGTYNCRTIAGTKRFSVHAFGAAIDINAKYGDYWRWSKPQPGEKLTHRNRIPWDIIEIFERHGFIWGGKWYHYDTLHFEYRPELLNGVPGPLVPVPEKRPVQSSQRNER